MRTRCKFRVVSVEEIEGEVHQKVYQDAEGYAEIKSQEWEEHHSHPTRKGQKYKMVPSGKYCQNVRLAAQYDSGNAEDVSFAEATPSGELKILVSNPAVIGNFRPGKCYYLDLIPCE